MKVPFLDLKVQYESIKDDIHASFEEVLNKTAFAGGPFVASFEEDYASFCGVKHAIAVGNGTDALWVSLVCKGIGAGDEVITVPNTFIATAEAISFSGATPVFVDVNPETYTMDPSKIEAAITPRTKAIIPVHLYGQCADMDPILAVAREYNLTVIEDACQAHASYYKGNHAGSLGDSGCFSFYPGKNLGAYGEGGGVITNDDELAAKIRMFRDHGQAKKYYHSMVGWNARMDGFQGAVLGIKLKRLNDWTESRRRNGHLYTELLSGVNGVTVPVEKDYGKHVYHIYPILVDSPDDVIERMKEHDIFCARHYPVPIHLQDAYSSMGLTAGTFPVAESSAARELSLPMFPELSEDQIRYVCDVLKDVIS